MTDQKDMPLGKEPSMERTQSPGSYETSPVLDTLSQFKHLIVRLEDQERNALEALRVETRRDSKLVASPKPAVSPTEFHLTTMQWSLKVKFFASMVLAPEDAAFVLNHRNPTEPQKMVSFQDVGAHLSVVKVFIRRLFEEEEKNEAKTAGSTVSTKQILKELFGLFDSMKCTFPDNEKDQLKKFGKKKVNTAALVPLFTLLINTW